MSTVAPVGGWSSTVSLTAGARFRYTATPGAGGSVRMQWTNGSLWFDFGNSNISAVTTSVIPAAATGIRGQGIGAAGSFDTVSDDPLAISYRGAVANEAAMTAITNAELGQYCLRQDTMTAWMLVAQPASTASNWIEFASPTSPQSGIATQFGVVNSGLLTTPVYMTTTGQPPGYSGPCLVESIVPLTVGTGGPVTIHDDDSASTAANMRFSRAVADMVAGTVYPLAGDGSAMVFERGLYFTNSTGGIYILNVVNEQ